MERALSSNILVCMCLCGGTRGNDDWLTDHEGELNRSFSRSNVPAAAVGLLITFSNHLLHVAVHQNKLMWCV